MDLENAKNLVSNKLKNIEVKDDMNLIVGNQLSNDSVVSTYFIDYGEGLPNNLRNYQERYIANIYYDTPGFIQWNYYLIFLREHYDDLSKNTIEKDGVFTRKFLFKPEELVSYFSYKKSEQSLETDVVGLWKEKLKEVDLDEVYSEEYYNHAIERFLNNKVKKEEITSELVSREKLSFEIQKISKIKLSNSFRKFPLEKNFTLGQVNLVTGVNGTGKTSFLESIELIIAGKTFRDSSNKGESGCIKALYNDIIEDEYTPNENAKYRNRDAAWYSSSYTSGNEMHRAFNKYNFYDTDAAYHLASGNDDLTSYLSSIALGQEFKRIQRRLEGFKERLNKEVSFLRKEIDDEKQQLKESKETLEKTNESSNPDSFFANFKITVKEYNWLREIPNESKGDFTNFLEDLELAKSYVHSLNKLLQEVKIVNLKGLNERLDNIKEIRKNFIKLTTSDSENKKTADLAKVRLDEINKIIGLLEKSKNFFEDADGFKLANLNSRIEKLEGEIKRYKRGLEFFEELSNDNIFKLNSKFREVQTIKAETLDDLEKTNSELKKAKSELKSSLDKLDGIVSEIKALGKDYISLNQNSKACPLCEKEYSLVELTERIGRVSNSLNQSESFEILNKSLRVVEADISNVKRTLNTLKKVESGLETLSNKEIATLSMQEVKELYLEIQREQTEKIDELHALVLLRQNLEDKGLFEGDFVVAKEAFNSVFPEITFEFNAKDKFNLTYDNLSNEKLESTKLIETIKARRDEIQSQQLELVSKSSIDTSIKSFETESEYVISLLTNGIQQYDDLRTYIDCREEEDIRDISLKLDKLEKLYERLKNILSEQKEIELAKKMAASANKKISDLQPKANRVGEAVSVIDNLLINYGETKVLGNFIEKNEKEIQEIFKNVHSPKEFSAVTFSNNSVMLKRENDDEEVPLNRISTGQRSALALSIFLALNKKLKNGPNIILFDDPVTFTDDLNILSFLDYLRELVINESRQLVFATANKKIASLFEKKFAFLGDKEFRKFEFKRFKDE